MSDYKFCPIDTDRLPEAVQRVNKLRTWFNHAAPEIVRIVSGAKLIANGEALSKRDMERVRPILDTAPFRAFLEVRNSSVWLRADITYPVKIYKDGQTVNYHEEAAFVGPGEVRIPSREVLNLDDVLETMKKLTVKQAELDRLEDEISELVNIVRPYGRS